MRENKLQVIADFDEVANMIPEELQEWLETDESREVGQKDADGNPPDTGRDAGSWRSNARRSPTTPTTSFA